VFRRKGGEDLVPGHVEGGRGQAGRKWDKASSLSLGHQVLHSCSCAYAAHSIKKQLTLFSLAACVWEWLAAGRALHRLPQKPDSFIHPPELPGYFVMGVVLVGLLLWFFFLRRGS
jgi:hypothetical protein